MELEWVGDLPENGRQKPVNSRLLRELRDELMAHPGQWAKYPAVPSGASPYTTASNINRGMMTSLKGCEARTVHRVVYVRYLPPDSSTADRSAHGAENPEHRADDD